MKKKSQITENFFHYFLARVILKPALYCRFERVRELYAFRILKLPRHCRGINLIFAFYSRF